MVHDYRVRLLALFLVFLSIESNGQEDCTLPSATAEFHANDIRTVVSNTGSLFQREGAQNVFQVPYENLSSPHALFAGGLWIGGFDDVGNLKLAAQTFRYGSRFDYGPGPLTPFGTPVDNPCQWDRIWSVSRNAILRHNADLADNGEIDQPIPAIFGWPGYGNTSFEQYNGFALDTTPQFGAPFADLDANGIYDPHLGDYPLPGNVDVDVIPSMISWAVFNDYSAVHAISGGDPLRVQLQLTTYAFSCENSPLLNQTLFTSYKIIQRNIATTDSVYVGIWQDPDLGCPNDDYFGSYPEGNTFFVYNMSPTDGDVDGNCIGTPAIETYGARPPVLSTTFLNSDMTSFLYTVNPGVGNPPPGMTSPETGDPLGFYRFLTGSWRDGLPISPGGSGYDPAATESVQFAFPGDPRDADSWAMTNIQETFLDRRLIGSVALPRLDPGDAFTVDVAYAFHSDSTQDHIGNVGLMYDHVDELQQLYQDGFSGACVYPDLPCTQEDCIYPGDTDHNGKVQAADYLSVAYGRDVVGPVRPGPLGFLPLSAADWNVLTPEHTDYKHIDCNGNGITDLSDFEIVDLHYGKETDWYIPGVQEFGDDLVIEAEDMELTVGESFFRVHLAYESFNIDSLYGITYSLEYDPEVFDQVVGGAPPHSLGFSNVFFRVYQEVGKWTWMEVATDLENRQMETGQLTTFNFFGNDSYQLSGATDTTYLRVTDVKAVMKDGTDVPLKGQEVAIYVIEDVVRVENGDVSPIRVYPNPSSGLVVLEYESKAPNVPFSIYRLTGQKVVDGDITFGRQTIELGAGVYQCVIHDSRAQVARIVVLPD